MDDHHDDGVEFEHLSIQLDEHVALLTIEREATLNALDTELLLELATAFDLVEGDARVRALVVTGAGRAFVAGADMKALAERRDGFGGRDAALSGQDVMNSLAALPIPTVAAINGFALGGGLELALACDLRVAADTARFSIPEVDLGIPLAWGGIPRLLREVPPAVARDLVLSCRAIDAAEALQVGLVSRVVPAGEVTGTVADLADALAAKARLPVRATLDAVRAELGIGSPRGWSDADTLLTAIGDPECREAATAYLARVFGADR